MGPYTFLHGDDGDPVLRSLTLVIKLFTRVFYKHVNNMIRVSTLI